MPLDVKEENVVPFLAMRRARLDARETDLVFRERLEQPEQRTWRVGVQRRTQDGGAIFAGRLEHLLAHYKKAGGVVLAILDLRGQHLQAVDVGSGLAGDGGRALLVAGAARGLGIAGDRDTRHLGQVFVEPATALRQRLRMAADALDLLETLHAAHQELMDAQLDLTADPQW